VETGSTLARSNPLMNIAAVAVIIASVAAVGAIFGLIPSARSERAEALSQSAAQAAGKPAGDVPGQSGMAAQGPGPGVAEAGPPAAPCKNCGVVEAVRAVQVQGEGTGLGAVAGGVTGAVVGSQFGKGNGRTAMGVLGAVGGAYAGHAVEKNVRTRTSYRVSVRMDDDTLRTLYSPNPPGFAVGDKVRVINGALAARG
jgi:outer membrane lipoprotein SlyB